VPPRAGSRPVRGPGVEAALRAPRRGRRWHAGRARTALTRILPTRTARTGTALTRILPTYAVLAIAAGLALTGALPAWGAAETILDKYRAALAAHPLPPYMEFGYVVTRSGPGRIVTEQHRVYWANDGNERNDTLSVNGTPLVPPASRIVHRITWPYDPAQFAVGADEYQATPAGVSLVNGRKAYAFILTKNAASDFMLKSLYVDVRTHLPLRETFAVTGDTCAGSGSIEFSGNGRYWLPSFVAVICTVPDTTPPSVYKESIRFTGYSFPKTIPPDVFTPPGQSGAPAGP
jgi:hypothetical protein